MRFRSLAALSVFSVALLASGAASATPTLTIDGITIPNGIAPGGNLITTEGSAESIVLALNKAVNDALPSLEAQLVREGADPVGGSPQQFGKFIADEKTKWAAIAQTAGISPQ